METTLPKVEHELLNKHCRHINNNGGVVLTQSKHNKQILKFLL